MDEYVEKLPDFGQLFKSVVDEMALSRLKVSKLTGLNTRTIGLMMGTPTAKPASIYKVSVALKRNLFTPYSDVVDEATGQPTRTEIEKERNDLLEKVQRLENENTLMKDLLTKRG